MTELPGDAAAFLERGDLEGALRRVCELADAVHEAAPARAGLPIGVPALDRLCEAVGAALLARRDCAPNAPEPSAGPPLDLYLATLLAVEGGHTRLISEWIRASPERRHLLVLTNLGNAPGSCSPELLRRLGLAEHEVLVADAPELLGKLAWLLETLHRERPARVFLFHHWHDAVAAAAVQPGLAGRFHFVHHVDRSVTLGTSASHACHVDLTPWVHHFCRAFGGARDAIYLPLACSDRGARESRHAPGPKLTSACSGSEHKFELDYRHPYPRVVAGVLAQTDGRHVHFGKLSQRFRAGLGEELARHRVPAERFVYVENVPSLWDAMEEHGVDVYLGSFPVRGALASVEVMGSGTPAIWHLESEQTRAHDTHMKYPEAEVWSTPEELSALLARVDDAWWAAQSKAARHHWEAFHSIEAPALRAFLSGDSEQGAQPPPAEGLVLSDQLQTLAGAWLEIGPARAELDRLRARIEELEAERPRWRHLVGLLARRRRARH